MPVMVFCTPAAAGIPVKVSVGAAAITTVNCFCTLTAAAAAPKVAETVNVELPATVGVPLMTPLVALRFNPAGKVPEAIAQLTAVGFPVTVRGAE